MTTILFLKARDRHDTSTADIFGTHVETHTRKDGVTQKYHVAAPAAPAHVVEHAIPEGHSKKFYVTMIRDKRVSRLAGPFDKHEDALAHVEPARKKANEVDPWSEFDAFGTAGITAAEHKPGVLNEHLGLGKQAPAGPVPPALNVPTLEHDGDVWHVVGTGRQREDGKYFVHLSSTTRGTQQKNGVSPAQINDWVELPTHLKPKTSRAAVLNALHYATSHIKKKSTMDWRQLWNAVQDFGTGELSPDDHMKVKRALDLIDHMSTTGRLSGTENLRLRDKIRGKEVYSLVQHVVDKLDEVSDAQDAVRSYFRDDLAKAVVFIRP